MSRYKKQKKKSRAAILLLLISIILIIGASFSFFSDYLQNQIAATAGTLRISLADPEITVTRYYKTGNNESSTTEANISNLNPGDIIEIKYNITNEGNKSAYLRNLGSLIVGNNVSTDAFSFYSLNTSNDDIRAGSGTALAVTTSRTINPNDTISFAIGPVIMNGKESSIGQEVETGGLNGNIKQGVKIYFNSTAGNEYQGIGLAFNITSQAIQYRNNTMPDWQQVTSVTLANKLEAVITYSTINPTEAVTALMITNSELAPVPDGWTQIDAAHYSKEYTANTTESISLTDVFGNTTTAVININNIKVTTIADLFSKGIVSVGDYVDYVPDSATVTYIVNGAYSGTGSNQSISKENLKWRVLDIQNGQVRLISDMPTSSILTLYGQNGYNNAVYLLNDLCKTLYSQSGIGIAKSINIEDIQSKMNLNVWDYHSYNKYNTTFSPNAGYRNYPLMLVNEQKQKVDGVNEGTLGLSEQTDPIIGATNAGSNWILTATFWQGTMASNNFNNSKDYELFMNNGAYWVASRCVNLDTNYVDYFIRSINGNNVGYKSLYATYSPYDITAACAMRPIITLNANVEVDMSVTGSDGSTVSTAWEIK